MVNNKYHNKKVIFNDLKFDSQAELKRYKELLLLEKAGEIRDIKTQINFNLIPVQLKNDGKIERGINYKADFVYFDKDDKKIVEDVKGFKTKDYIIKRKLMLWRHEITIKEVVK